MHMYQDAEATVIEMDFSQLEEAARLLHCTALSYIPRQNYIQYSATT